MTDGYVKAPHDIVRDPSLSTTAKVAWLLISGMPEGYHPTREQWMAMLPCKEKGAWRRAVNELLEAGLIEVERCGNRKLFKAILRGGKSTPLKGGKINPFRVEKPPQDGVENQPKEGLKNLPLKKNIIEEQKKNNLEARARMREEVMQDMMVETGCRSVGITPAEYQSLAQEIFNDWTFQDIPDSEWNKSHFLAVLRIKANELKKKTNEQRVTNADPVARRQVERQQRVAEIAAATAAFAAQGQRSTEEIF